jgi:TolB-like protein/Tfp pilus assembly protein PilF
MSLITELKRRNVIRMAGLYLVGAWLLVQVAGTLLPVFDAPAWIMKTLVLFLALAFAPSLVFAWVFELTPDGLKRDAEVSPQESIAPQTARKMNHAIIVVLALAVAYFGFDKFVLAPRREAAMLALASHSTATSVTDKSIAVLPLTNESGDKDQLYFSDGLSENLIVALSQFSGLKVIGRNSSFQFRDTRDDSRTIGTKLGVATLLEGSVQHAGDAVRISAELIRAADGSTIWTQRYDRPYKDLFALQDEITKEVAGALKTKLLANDNTAVQTDRPPSDNLDAYAAYLQGNFHAARNSESDLEKAIEQYATATRLDPHYALASAASAQAGARLAAGFLAGAEQREVYSRARDAANSALMLDPNLAAAHSARGSILQFVEFDWSGAESEFRRALQLSPNDSEATGDLGSLLATRGQPGQAIELLRRSLGTDPLHPVRQMLLSKYLAALGRLDEAERAIRKAVELQPAAGIFDARLVEIEVERGDAKSALATTQRTLPGIWRDFALALALQIGNDHAAADAALKLLIDQHADGMAYQIAQVYALRRDPDNTFAWLDRALANHDAGIQFLLVDRFILRYRDDPRFAAFCRKVGLSSTTTAKALP